MNNRQVCSTELNWTIERFETGAIDPEQFDHAAHVRVAWLYVMRYEPIDALRRFDTALKRLVRNLGDEDKYHATLTWFFLLLIAERACENESWQTFSARNPDLFSSRSIIARYYSGNRLNSDEARKGFLLPDNIAA